MVPLAQPLIDHSLLNYTGLLHFYEADRSCCLYTNRFARCIISRYKYPGIRTAEITDMSAKTVLFPL